jgi:hypothetical protein
MKREISAITNLNDLTSLDTVNVFETLQINKITGAIHKDIKQIYRFETGTLLRNCNSLISDRSNLLSDTEIVRDKKVCFLKGCVFPRYKLADLKLSHNLSVVRDSDKADFLCIDNKFLLEDHLYEYISLKDFIDNLRPYSVTSFSKKAITWRDNISSELNFLKTAIYNFLENKIDVNIFIKVNEASKFIDDLYHVLYITHILDNKVYHLNAGFNRHFYSSQYIKGFDKITFDQIKDKFDNNKLINTNLFNRLTSSSYITDDVYKQLDQMLNSSDKDNHELAIVLISNCDYQKSAFYYVLLWRKHYNKMARTKAFKSVGMKTFLQNFPESMNRFIYGNLTSHIKDIISYKTPIIFKEHLPLLKSILTDEILDSLRLDKSIVSFEGLKFTIDVPSETDIIS